MDTFFSTIGRLRTRSIVVRIIGLGLALVAFGLGARLAIVPPFLGAEIGGAQAARLLSTAGVAARGVDASVEGKLGQLRLLAQRLSPAMLDDAAALAAWLQARRAELPAFSRRLEVISGATIAPIGRLGRSSDGGVEVALATPVAGRSGAHLVSVVALEVFRYLEACDPAQAGTAGEEFLLISPRDGIVIEREAVAGLPPRDVDPLLDKALSGWRGVGTGKTASGGEALSAAAGAETTGWIVIARMPAEQAFAIVATGRRVILWSGLFIAAVVILVSGMLFYRFFRPLTDAAQQMREMADGLIELAPLPVERRDEVGELAHGFNYLLGKLREKEAALRDSEARLAHMAHHDVLTGLPNRAMLEDRLHQAIAHSRRAGTAFALMFLDLDDFKPINDAHGHAVGDAVLREAARRLVASLRKADTAARIGGDEFAVLLEESDLRSSFETVAGKCVDALSQPVRVGELSLEIGISIGVALYPDNAREAERLFACADQAMYAAKKAGGGRWAVFDGASSQNPSPEARISCIDGDDGR